MFKIVKLSVLGAVCALSTFAWAADADPEGSYTSYENLVNQLKASAETPAPIRAPKFGDDFDWDEVSMHGGVAFATSLTSVGLPGGAGNGSGLLKGVEFNFGVNLFSRKLRAEGAFGDYSNGDLSGGLRAELKEFETRLVYTPNLNAEDTLRLGTGFALRDITITQNARNFDSDALNALFLIGVEHKVSKSIALGPDLSYRSSVSGDSLEKSAWDASFRLNATF